MKKALITGISGQDGSYLAELLLSKNYQVFGALNRDSNAKNLRNIHHLLNKIEICEYSLNDKEIADNLIKIIHPDECYHLAGSSFVDYSQDNQNLILNNNVNSTNFLLDAIKNYTSNCRFFLAGSSEMFGLSNESPQSENSIFNPQNIYGVSKLKAFDLVKIYRENYKIFACCGILYNHESPRRNEVFFTRKVSQNVAKIYLGLAKEIELGDIESSRDFGYAKDYVEAFFLMLQNSQATDYVISSGSIYQIKEILKIAFDYVNLDYEKYIKINPNLIRPSPKIQLFGDNSKIKKELNWQPQADIKKIIYEMIENDIVLLKTQNKIK
jgi:GDPmannose 4,6-dehydratase